MATVELYDSREPVDAGEAILADALEGRPVVADRQALIHALYETARLLGEEWDEFANLVAHLVGSVGDEVVAQHIRDCRLRIEQVTEIALSIFAAQSSGFRDCDDCSDVGGN